MWELAFYCDTVHIQPLEPKPFPGDFHCCSTTVEQCTLRGERQCSELISMDLSLPGAGLSRKLLSSKSLVLLACMRCRL